MDQLPWVDRLVGLYTGALASLRLRDFARAERATAAAQALLDGSGKTEPAARQLLARQMAQVKLARGDVAGAAAALDAGAADDGSRSGLLLQADWALADGSPAALKRSAEALQAWTSGHREDAGAWHLLSRTADLQGQTLRSVRAEAESEAALGNLGGAVDRLRAGQRLARQGGVGVDFIEASVIDARLRDLLAQRRQLIADERRAGERPRNDSHE
jgi:predicted Zn-dependent protease